MNLEDKGQTFGDLCIGRIGGRKEVDSASRVEDRKERRYRCKRNEKDRKERESGGFSPRIT